MRHLGRDFLVHVELLAVCAASVGERMQHRRVLVELRLRHVGLHLGEAAVLLGAEDLPAPRRQVAHHGALILVGRPHLRSEEHTSELQSPCNLVCRLLLEKKKKNKITKITSYQTLS